MTVRAVRKLSKGRVAAETYRASVYDQRTNEVAEKMRSAIEASIRADAFDDGELAGNTFVEEGTEERVTHVGVRGDHSKNPYGPDSPTTVALLQNFGSSKNRAVNFMERGAEVGESEGLERG